MEKGRRLIVNADGFGFGSGATRGVIDAIREGKFISSISITPNFPDVERVCEVLQEFPRISVGIHLNPMAGKPCSPPDAIPSLVDKDGCLHGLKFPLLLRRGLISREDLEVELEAQMRKVHGLVGSRLTHIDSHGNRHLAYFDLFLKIAGRWGLHRMRNNASLICLESEKPRISRLRAYSRKPQIWLAHQYRQLQMLRARRAGFRMADRLITVGYADNGNKTNIDNWRRILRNLPEGTYEIYCHPAYPDRTLERWAKYNQDRAQELAILRTGELREDACRLGVEIIGFNSI